MHMVERLSAPGAMGRNAENLEKARLAAPAESKRFWMLRGCITPEKTLRAALRKGVSRVGLQARKRLRRHRSPPLPKRLAVIRPR